ncbi:hypothetical protein RB195_014453 [Necator americanus]|uniref:Transthyretin-like family protein n=1 Tax=Necator americanus TaxID=51031 RepID=A0ABR1E092_NECAM
MSRYSSVYRRELVSLSNAKQCYLPQPGVDDFAVDYTTSLSLLYIVPPLNHKNISSTTPQMKFLVALALIGVALAMRDQSIAVRGKLMCGPKPASNVRVKLWEEDSGTVHPEHSVAS